MLEELAAAVHTRKQDSESLTGRGLELSVWKPLAAAAAAARIVTAGVVPLEEESARQELSENTAVGAEPDWKWKAADPRPTLHPPR